MTLLAPTQRCAAPCAARLPDRFLSGHRIHCTALWHHSTPFFPMESHSFFQGRSWHLFLCTSFLIQARSPFLLTVTLTYGAVQRLRANVFTLLLFFFICLITNYFS